MPIHKILRGCAAAERWARRGATWTNTSIFYNTYYWNPNSARGATGQTILDGIKFLAELVAHRHDPETK